MRLAHFILILGSSVAFTVGFVIGCVMPSRYHLSASVLRLFKVRRVAVIGAGIAGLSCARRLSKLGYTVTVFEKERQMGGRLRSLRSGGHEIDIWAQGIDDPILAGDRFEAVLHAWARDGNVCQWRVKTRRFKKPEVTSVPADASADDERDTWIGTPRMSSLVEAAAGSVFVHQNVSVASMLGVKEAWQLVDSKNHRLETFHYVVLATPPGETIGILEQTEVDWKDQLEQRLGLMEPCWAVIVSFNTQQAASDGDQRQTNEQRGINRYRFEKPCKLFSAILESAKPNRTRDGFERWVLHSRTDYAAANPTWEAGKPPRSETVAKIENEVAQELSKEFWDWTKLDKPKEPYLDAHYLSEAIVGAFPSAPADWYFFDNERGIGACGDWCVRQGVGHAWSSGRRLADRIDQHHRHSPFSIESGDNEDLI